MLSPRPKNRLLTPWALRVGTLAFSIAALAGATIIATRLWAPVSQHIKSVSSTVHYHQASADDDKLPMHHIALAGLRSRRDMSERMSAHNHLHHKVTTSQTSSDKQRINSAGSTDSTAAPKGACAFATFYSAQGRGRDAHYYFIAVRTLVYQLLHQPETATALNIPVLVLVAPTVRQAQRQQLEHEGATVLPVADLHVQWGHVGQPRWLDTFMKLHVFRLTQYERVCFLDAGAQASFKSFEHFLRVSERHGMSVKLLSLLLPVHPRTS